jgi:hypothetical protein
MSCRIMAPVSMTPNARLPGRRRTASIAAPAQNLRLRRLHMQGQLVTIRERSHRAVSRPAGGSETCLRPAVCYREAHNFPTSPRPGEGPHRKPTDETELCGTRRHGRYDG